MNSRLKKREKLKIKKTKRKEALPTKKSEKETKHHHIKKE